MNPDGQTHPLSAGFTTGQTVNHEHHFVSQEDQQQLLCLISRSINVLGCSARSKSPFVQLLRQLQTLTAVSGSEGSNCRSFLSQSAEKLLKLSHSSSGEHIRQLKLTNLMSSDSQATALDSDHSSECTLAYVLFLSEFSCFRYVKNVRPLTRPGRDKRRGRVSSSAERQGLSARGKSLHSQGIKKLNPIAAVERPKGLRKGDRHRVEKTPQKRLRLWMRVSEEYAGVSHVESLREISQSSPGLSRCQT